METLSQILIAIVFIGMFVAIASGKIHRFIPAMVCGVITLVILFAVLRDSAAVLSTLNFNEMGLLKFWYPANQHLESHGVNWQTIIFIGGMMIMVEGLTDAGFFRWVCLFIARLVHYRVISIFIVFMLLAGFLSMFIDSITVMLFLASVTIEIARLLKFNPVPVIISEICAANIGGSATMAGDPPNIIIGTAFGYTFTDFLANTGPIAWIGLIAAIGFFFLCFRKVLKNSPDTHNKSTGSYPQPREAITNMSMFKINSGIFFVVIILLITHAQTGISVATIGVIAALLTLMTARNRAVPIIKRTDWRTLLFFIGLFIVVGGLEATGALVIIANLIQNISGGNIILVMTIILWVSAFASAIVDNIPFAATMVPVISSLAADASTLRSLSWTLALGTDIGGNATPIGASANVVGIAIAEREGYPISWGKYMKFAIPSVFLVIGICWGLLFWWHF